MAERRSQLVDGQWSGAGCVIVGGGPSLCTFDWDLLRGLRVIACNSAWPFASQVGPDELVIFSRDRRWMLRFGEEALESGHRCVYQQCEDGDFPGWDTLGTHRHMMWPRMLGDGLVENTNTGMGALCLAYLLGANPITVLGFDMHGEAGLSACFHDKYDFSWRHSDEKYQEYISEFSFHLLELVNRVIVVGDGRASTHPLPFPCMGQGRAVSMVRGTMECRC